MSGCVTAPGCASRDVNLKGKDSTFERVSRSSAGAELSTIASNEYEQLHIVCKPFYFVYHALLQRGFGRCEAVWLVY